MHDDVTGLADVELLADHTTRALARTERGGSVAIVVCDLDGFVVVNELLGRVAGDALLREAAGRLRGCCRAGDVVARIGPNAFALLLADLPPDPDRAGDVAHDRAEVLRDALRRPYLGSEAVAVSASVGVAITPDSDTTAVDLLAAARVTRARPRPSAARSWSRRVARRAAPRRAAGPRAA